MYTETLRTAVTILCIYAHWRVLEFLRIYAELFSFWLSLLILELLRMYAEKLCVTNTVLRIYAHWRVLEFLRIYAELFSFWLSLLILEFLRMYAEKLRVPNTVLRIYAHWRVLEFLRICAGTPTAWIVINITNVSTMCRSPNIGVSVAVRRYSKFGWKINSNNSFVFDWDEGFLVDWVTGTVAQWSYEGQSKSSWTIWITCKLFDAVW